MKTSCINHPPREELIMVRRWQVEYTGDRCAAAVLSFLEYWHNIKLGSSSQNAYANDVAELHGETRHQQEGLHQWHTADAIEAGLLGLFSRDKIRVALIILEALGAVTVGNNPNSAYKFDRTRYFWLHPEAVNEWLWHRSVRTHNDQISCCINKGAWLGSKKTQELNEASNPHGCAFAINRNRDAETRNSTPIFRNSSAINRNGVAENRRTITETTPKTSTERSPLTPQGVFKGASEENENFPPEGQPQEKTTYSDEAQPAIAPAGRLTPAKVQQLETNGVIGGGGSAAAPMAVESEIDLTAPHNAGLAMTHRRKQRIQSEQEALGITQHLCTRNINTTEARLRHAGAASKWISSLSDAYTRSLAPLGGTVGSPDSALSAWCDTYGEIPPDAEFFEDFTIYAKAIAAKKKLLAKTVPCSLATFIREHTTRMEGAIAYLDKAPTAAPKVSNNMAKVNSGMNALLTAIQGGNTTKTETTAINPWTQQN